jgi:hypothetical protein
MRHRSAIVPPALFFLGLAISLFLTACAGGHATKPPVPGGLTVQDGCDAAQWTIDFTRSGGFAGQTLTLHLLSSGLLTASGQAANVRSQAPADKLAQIGLLLREACPFAGSAGSNPRDCQDCFSYTLQVSMGGQTFLLQATQGHLGNLGSLIEALNALLEKALAG